MASYTKTVKDGVRDDTGARAQFLLVNLSGAESTHQGTYGIRQGGSALCLSQWQSKGLFEMARSFAQENQINEAKTVFNKLIEKYLETSSARAAKEELNRLN